MLFILTYTSIRLTSRYWSQIDQLDFIVTVFFICYCQTKLVNYQCFIFSPIFYIFGLH